MSTTDSPSQEDNELTLFLEAVREANRRDDSSHLESEVEVRIQVNRDAIKRIKLRKQVIFCSFLSGA